MCLICVEYNRNKLTLNEAWKNLHEMTEVIGEDHTWEVINKLWEEELKNEEERERSKLNSKN
jgi:hypothetical protein